MVKPPELFEGDCLDILRLYPADYFDLVFTSPPYEDCRTYGIDFNLKGQEWVDWARERFIECVRVTKGLVAWVVEGKTKQFRYTVTPALLMADLHRAGIKLRKPPIFHRVGIPGSGGPDWLRNDYEFIVCATKGKLPWSDNTAMGHPPKWAPGGAMSHRLGGRKRTQWGGSEKSGGHTTKTGKKVAFVRPSHQIVSNSDARVENDEPYTPPVKANPGNVIKAIVGGGVMGNKLAHENEAPFPESLAEFFIRSFCPPGGLVLDPFCGSGTTLAVAERNGRNSVGIDIRASQIDLSQRRIAG